MSDSNNQLICFPGKRLFLLAAVVAFSWISSHAAAQSIRIQSWKSYRHAPIGGISIGPLVVPIVPHSHEHHYHGHHHHEFRGFGQSGFGYPGFSYGLGVPYQSFSFSIGSPYGYDPFPYRSDYFDYRSDYNRRLYDSYQRDLRRDLFDSNLGLDFGQGIDSYAPFGDRSYRPPVAQIEPFYNNGFPGTQPFGEVPQSTPSRNLPEALRAAANRLSISLSRLRDDGDVWLDYLAPGRIVSTLDQGLPIENLAELLRNFDGVVGNPELRFVAAADGFDSTRRLLRQLLEAGPTGEQGPTVAPEPMPREEIAPAPADVPAEAALIPKRRSV